MSSLFDSLINLLTGISNTENGEDEVMNNNNEEQDSSTVEKIAKGVISFTGSCATRCMQTGCDKSMAHHSKG